VVGRQRARHLHDFLAIPAAQAPDAERVVALLDRQALVAAQVLQALRRAVPGEIGGRRAQDAAVVHQPARDQVRRDLVAHAHVEVEAFGDRIDQPVEHLETDLQAGMGGDQPGDRRRHQLAPEAEAAADAYPPARRAAPLRDFVDQVVEVVEDGLGAHVDLLAVVGDGDAARGTLEQAHAEHALEHADALADIGGRHAELLGGSDEAALADDGDEDAQVFVLQRIIHKTCSYSSR